ncbi:MAG TPA: SDR family NAD(P)-dependent oxidoreductase, partial [Conexibacter sp.]
MLRLARRVAARAVNPGGAPSATTLRRAVAGRTVLDTGASHGIGRATAIRLARAGATVLLVARSADLLEELAEQLRADGAAAHALPADLSDTDDAVPALARRILSEHDPPDVIVNNAGKSIRRAVAQSFERFHDYTRTTDLNYLGP